jgi:hypothetical protein
MTEQRLQERQEARLATQKLKNTITVHLGYHFPNHDRMQISQKPKSPPIYTPKPVPIRRLVVAMNNPFLLALAAQAVALIPLLEAGVARELLLKPRGTGVVFGARFAGLLALILQDGSELLTPARFLQNPSLPLGLNNLSLYPVDKP